MQELSEHPSSEKSGEWQTSENEEDTESLFLWAEQILSSNGANLY
jgi:hypothetical protein